MNTSEKYTVRSFSSKFLFLAQKNLVLLQRLGFLRLEIPNESISEEISVNEVEEPSNRFAVNEYDNYKIHYSGKSANVAQSSNFGSCSSFPF